MTRAQGGEGQGAGLTRADFLQGAAATGLAGLGLLPAAGRAAPAAATAGGRPVVSAFIRAVLGMDMPTLARFLEDADFDGAEVPVRATLSTSARTRWPSSCRGWPMRSSGAASASIASPPTSSRPMGRMRKRS